MQTYLRDKRHWKDVFTDSYSYIMLQQIPIYTPQMVRCGILYQLQYTELASLVARIGGAI